MKQLALFGLLGLLATSCTVTTTTTSSGYLEIDWATSYCSAAGASYVNISVDGYPYERYNCSTGGVSLSGYDSYSHYVYAYLEDASGYSVSNTDYISSVYTGYPVSLAFSNYGAGLYGTLELTWTIAGQPASSSLCSSYGVAYAAVDVSGQTYYGYCSDGVIDISLPVGTYSSATITLVSSSYADKTTTGSLTAFDIVSGAPLAADFNFANTSFL